MREKRQHQRAVLEVPVRVIPTDGPPWETRSLDISVGGMLLFGESASKIGTEVMLSFELSSKLGLVNMPGYIRWASARGVGIQFGLIGPREVHAIGRLVREQAVAS